jgi:hypothetical protein
MKFSCWLKSLFHIGYCYKCKDCRRCGYHGVSCKNCKLDYGKLRQILIDADIYDEDGFEK